MKARWLAIAALTLACGRLPGGGEDQGEPARPVREGKALFESGQLDAALGELSKAPDDPESLYYQGRVWARKAEQAPLPTPPPPPSPVPRGWQPPPAPEMKPEELQAAQLYERALAARPDHAGAHLALAQLLAPHAARRHDLAEEAARHKKSPPPAAALPVDVSADRVIREYQFAMQADPAATAPVEELIRFGRRVARFDAAEAGFKEIVRRKREAETAEPLAQYGDFLAEEKKDPLGAIEQYRQALIWRPDDDALRAKVAAIYLKMAAESFAKQQYAVTGDHLREAERYITDRGSAQAQTLETYKDRLRTIRR